MSAEKSEEERLALIEDGFQSDLWTAVELEWDSDNFVIAFWDPITEDFHPTAYDYDPNDVEGVQSIQDTLAELTDSNSEDQPSQSTL